MAKEPEYEDRMEQDSRWVVIGTGGGFTGWARPLRDGAQLDGREPSWLLTYGDGMAPPESRRGPVLLTLEERGSTIAQAKCRGVADAVALANRFYPEGGQ